MRAQETVVKMSRSTGNPSMGRTALNADIGSSSEEDIIRRFDRVIGYHASRYRIDEDDLKQVGRIALLKALRGWQEKPHTASFWTYARKAVLGAMLDFATAECTRAVLEQSSGFEPSGTCPPDVALEAKEHVSSLPPREACVLTMRESGFDTEEIAKQANISSSHVYTLVRDSMENIRKRA